MLKNLFFLGVLLFSSTQLCAQINGLSASKLNAFNVAPLPHKEAELEPTWNYMRNKGPIGSDSVILATNLMWRVTYGVVEGAELGFTAPSDFSSLCMSSKVRVHEGEKFSLGLMAGLGFNFQNGLLDPDQSLLSYYAAGLIASYELDNKNTLDFNIQTYQNVGGGPLNVFMSADWGSYMINEKILLILSATYNHSSASKVLMLSPGISIESSENFFIVVNPAITLLGADAEIAPQTFGIGLSFTTFWK